MTVRIDRNDDYGYPLTARCEECGEVWTFDPDGETLTAFGLLHDPAEVPRIHQRPGEPPEPAHSPDPHRWP